MLIASPVVHKRRFGTVEMPAPVKGLNLKDALASVDPAHALRLNNWVCRRDGLHVRQGSSLVTAGNGDAISGIFSYPGKLLHSTANGIYSGDTLMAGGMAGGEWQAATIPNAAGQWMVMCNGTDVPRIYNGASVAQASITGVPPHKLFSPVLHGQRLFFALQNSFDLWYLPLHNIAGELRPFPIAPLFRKGGAVSCIASMSMDGGRGPDDMFLIVTTNGELAAYAGTNPDNADGFRLAGVWDVPVPVGRTPFVRQAGGMLLMTQAGMFKVSDLMTAPEDAQRAIAVTDMINNPASTEFVHSPRHGFSVLGMGDGSQFVREAETGGWSRWHGLDATCWTDHEGDLYFGTSHGETRKYGGPVEDIVPGTPVGQKGRPVEADFAHGFSDYGATGPKMFTRIQMVYEHYAPVCPAISMLTDFDDVSAFREVPAVDELYPEWGQAEWGQFWKEVGETGFERALQMAARAPINDGYNFWDEVSWGDYWKRRGKRIMTRWHDIRAHGYSGALFYATRTRAPMTYQSSRVRMEAQGGI